MADPSAIPVFSDRLTEVLDRIFKGEAPNAGGFCGYCFTPISSERTHCPHCERAVADHKPVDSVPDPILMMFKQLRRRESVVVNGFAYIGLFAGIAIFTGIFYVLFSTGASVWWHVFNIVLLFVSARALAGLLGGFIGDEVGYSYARRKLSDDWEAYEEQGRPATLETLKE